MKKLIIASILAGSLFAQASYAEGRYGSTPSEISVISVILSPMLSSAAVSSLFTELSRSSTPIKVTHVEHKQANKTLVKGVAKNTPVEFEADTMAVIKAKVKENENINVKETNAGHILDCNNVVLGIVPSPENTNNFTQKKLN